MRKDRFELDPVGRALGEAEVDLAEVLEEAHLLAGGEDVIRNVGKIAVDRLQDVFAGRPPFD